MVAVATHSPSAPTGWRSLARIPLSPSCTRAAEIPAQSRSGAPFHGRATVRWSLGPASAWQEALCRIEDVAETFRLPEELGSIQALERPAELLRSDVLSKLADLRRRLVAARLRRAAGEFKGRAQARELLAAGERMECWRDEGDDLTDGQRETRTYALRDRRELLEAAEALLTFDGGLEAPEVRAVGEAGLVSLQELQPLLESAARTIGLPRDDGPGLIVKARRFPVEDPPGQERFKNPLENPLSLVDRLDAVEALYELVPAVRARSLVRDVRALLGYSLRDADVLRKMLDRVRRRPGFPRDAFLVGLGMLGEPVDLSCAPLLAGTGETATAWVLGCVLAGGAQPGGRWGQSLTSGSGRRVLRTARQRLKAGLTLSVVG